MHREHLYKTVYPSIGLSVHRSVCQASVNTISTSRRQKEYHKITSSYNPFIIMRTHRWPYGPCSIFFFLLKVFNICRSRLRQTRVIIWLSLSPEWICLFDASKLKWSESERSRVGIFTVLSLYRIRFWAAAPKGAMCLTIKLTSAVYNFIAVAMICYGL